LPARSLLLDCSIWTEYLDAAVLTFWSGSPVCDDLSGRDAGAGASRPPDAVPARSELGSPLAGEDQAGLSSNASTGDVEGGAVVDRHPYDRQPDGDINAIVAIDRLERGVALVVVTDHDDVPLASDGGGDQGIRREGPVGVDPTFPGSSHRRGKHVGVLVAEDPVLAGVRVQAGYPDGLVGSA
jgi:hypothetical protein